ncbi:UDP-N-acetylmuramoyl-L-alanyl-D-glutamate--2,6-diaminopimelate ligase [Litchfieldia alkalitelluris]|uniref:UDP-N-acetylmuramoyl-L-alanyl-D-glutamate--2, 6-diaminopimelate ligase n=1 Tax=Litchfieldia alkalitelluris TaxID=304268 RepID=UPI000B449EEC|nr:UDP-N-acetylmuramoyl-L-alanyl-D-glutamate--2,6-diaminopimelate ligase [Litchfieldia alkalitelluris]
MKLIDVIRGLAINNDVGNNDNNVDVKGITDNSLHVKEGDLFVAIKGHKVNGHDYIDQVIEAGAAAIVGEEEHTELPIPYLQVNNSRKALGTLAKNYYMDPSAFKVMIGITGTNGKTTTSYILKHILEENGLSCTLIGTINNIVNGEVVSTTNTTPSSLVINELIFRSNDPVVIMEVSSHGIDQYRVEGISFDYCLFTNFTRDHLDYHLTIENYFQAKRKLFDQLKPNGLAVINTDDEWAKKLNQDLISKGKRTFTVGQSKNNDISFNNAISSNKKSINITEKEESYTVDFAMPGLHNFYNMLSACATSLQIINSTEAIIDSIKTFSGVKGRFEIIRNDNGSTFVVDYAHTSDGLLNILNTVNEFNPKGIIHIFGMRGNRDVAKYKDMLKISASMSTLYILTMDDLNLVSYQSMLRELEVLNEQFGNQKGIIIPDRTLAIKYAIENSAKDDWIIITGKGHEKYQQSYFVPTQSDMETIEHFI